MQRQRRILSRNHRHDGAIHSNRANAPWQLMLLATATAADVKNLLTIKLHVAMYFRFESTIQCCPIKRMCYSVAMATSRNVPFSLLRYIFIPKFNVSFSAVDIARTARTSPVARRFSFIKSLLVLLVLVFPIACHTRRLLLDDSRREHEHEHKAPSAKARSSYSR